MPVPDYKTPFEFDMALIPPVFEMMKNGIRVDEEERERLREQHQSEWDDYQAKLNSVVGRPLNVNSSPQMKQWLYKDLGLPKRKDKGRLTANEDALRSLMALCEEKVKKLKTASGRERWLRGFLSIKLTLLIRSNRTLLSRYINAAADADGRMRTTISIGGTETFRFSHSKTLWDTGCNLATIPRKLRTMFVPSEGYEIAEFDLNRGESWVYTFLSMDPELIRIHTTNGDFHSETAVAIQSAFADDDDLLALDELIRLNKAGDDFAYKVRYLGKRVNHASAYRMGPYQGARVINLESDDTNITVTPSQVKNAQKLWRDKYLGITSWWNEIDRELENTRKLTTPYGRIRTFYGFMSDHLKKEATAYVPQSTSVDYLNRGMLRVFHNLVVPGVCGLRLLHQNHDSILVEYPHSYREEIFPLIQKELTSELTINGETFSIPVEGSYGQNWKELTEWKG